MSRDKLKKIWLLIGLILLLDICLVLIFPVKAPKVEDFTFPKTPVDPQFQIKFSEPMDRETVIDAFRIEPNTSGKFSWSGRNLVFTPEENLRFDQTYNIYLDKSATSERGQQLAENWSQIIKTDPLRFLYISTDHENFGQLMLYQFNRDTKAITKEEVRDFDYDPTNKSILIHYKKGTGEIYNLETKKITEIPETNKILRMKWLPFENSALISIANDAEYENIDLILFDLDNNTLEKVSEGPHLIYNFFPTPDGRGIMSIDQTGDLKITYFDDDSEQLITRDFLQHFGFSEYGGYLLYTTLTSKGIFDLSNNLVLQDSVGNKEVILKDSNIAVEDASISPNEKYVLFKHRYEASDISYTSNHQVALLDLKTKELKLLTPENLDIDAPNFSPDGSHISFIEAENSGFDLNNSTLVGGDVFIYKLSEYQNTKPEIIPLNIKAAQIEWLY